MGFLSSSNGTSTGNGPPIFPVHCVFGYLHMTVRICRNIHLAIWRDLFFTTGQTVFFFRASARKTKNKNLSHGTRPGDTMGVSGYCSLFCLWAVRARSAQGRVFTEPWATPPTTGAMKIERGVVYDPTIHHWLLVRKKLSSWVPPAMASTAAYRPSAAVPLEGAR
jgi:hypothetical protein